ncbi:MAG: ethylbenzene dehydrogenase-related protein [Candidatus Kariarchaeaceae archaeon]|jgi:hypothetical protein
MKRKLVTGLVIAIMVFGIQMSFVVDSFPGFHSSGDCNLCHNYPATAYNSSFETYNLDLDGELDEPIWDDHSTYGRRTMVPVAGRFGSAHVFLTVYFGQNSSHFFMAIGWEDETINGADEDRTDTDGVAVMFNINVTDFDTGYGMDRAPGDSAVDVITWRPAASETGQELYQNDYVPKAIESNLVDEHIYDDDRDGDATNEWEWAAVHGNVSNHNEHNYNVEFVRPLVTDDPNDVQFSESKYYEFGIALFNDTSNSGHWISPAYEVYVYNGPEVTETVTETVTEDAVTVTQVETESKNPLEFLPILLALFVTPTVILLRRKT